LFCRLFATLLTKYEYDYANLDPLIIHLNTFSAAWVGTGTIKLFATIISNILYIVSGLYYKHITIVNDDTSIVNKLGASLTDDTRVVIYDHHMFIEQAIGCEALCLARKY
jgi:hypothetical protein